MQLGTKNGDVVKFSKWKTLFNIVSVEIYTEYLGLKDFAEVVDVREQRVHCLMEPQGHKKEKKKNHICI